MIGLDTLKNIQSVHLGKLQIKKDRPREIMDVPARVLSGGKDVLKCLFTVSEDRNVVGNAVLFQGPQHELDVAWIIFDQEYIDTASVHAQFPLSGIIRESVDF